MTEPNYQCEILEEKPKTKPKTQKIKLWNDYSIYYVLAFILTVGTIFLYYMTKDKFFFRNSEGNIKNVITLLFVCIFVIGVAGVSIKTTQMTMLTSKKKTKNVIMKYVKNKTGSVNSQKKKLLAEIILSSYMIFIGIISLAVQKFGKTPTPTLI